MMTTEIYGNQGTLTVDVLTGKVINYEPMEDGYYTCVTKVNLSEFKQAYGFDDVMVANTPIDILDIGYWLGDETYEPPAFEWRAGHWISDLEIRKDFGL